MSKCEECDCLGSEWCIACTVVSLEEYMQAHNVKFRPGHQTNFQSTIAGRPSGGDPSRNLCRDGVEAYVR